MKIQYLGTAAAEALPAPYCRCRICCDARHAGGRARRTRSQAVIDDTLVIDFPPDTYDHMLRFGLDLRETEHILLTHSHDDHFYPQDLILKRPDVALDMPCILTVYGNGACRLKYEEAVVRERRPLKDFTDWQRFETVKSFECFQAGRYEIQTLAASHAPGEDSLLFIISDGKKQLFYGNDSGLFPEKTWQVLENSRLDLVSLDCTMLLCPRVPNHMNLEDVLLVRERLLRSGAAGEGTIFVLTHFSHNGGMTRREIETFARKHGFIAAWDGLSVEI